MGTRLWLVLFALVSLAVANAQRSTSAPPQKATSPEKIQFRWDVQHSGLQQDLHAVFFLNAQAGWAAGDESVVLKTTDGGKTWKQMMEARPGSPRFTEVAFVNEREGWMEARDALLHTSDGGESWQPAAKLPAPLGGYGPASVVGSMRFQLAPPTTSAHLFLTDDGGRTWTKLETSLPTNSYEAISFSDSTHGWLARAGQKGLAMTSDGGKSWRIVEQKFYGRGPKIKFLNERVGWAFGEDATSILTTSDGGQTWTSTFTRFPQYYHLADMQFLDEHTGFVLANSQVIATTNGNSWNLIGKLSEASALSFPDASHGWVVGRKGYIVHYHPVPLAKGSEKD